MSRPFSILATWRTVSKSGLLRENISNCQNRRFSSDHHLNLSRLAKEQILAWSEVECNALSWDFTNQNKLSTKLNFFQYFHSNVHFARRFFEEIYRSSSIHLIYYTFLRDFPIKSYFHFWTKIIFNFLFMLWKQK